MLAMRREISRDEIILDLIVSEYIYIFKMLVVLFFIESLLHFYNLEKNCIKSNNWKNFEEWNYFVERDSELQLA